MQLTLRKMKKINKKINIWKINIFSLNQYVMNQKCMRINLKLKKFK
jgi:hypothetical protein